MTRNTGILDKLVLSAVGVVLLAVTFHVSAGPIIDYGAGIVLIPSFIGVCPVYRLPGMKIFWGHERTKTGSKGELQCPTL